MLRRAHLRAGHHVRTHALRNHLFADHVLWLSTDLHRHALHALDAIAAIMAHLDSTGHQRGQVRVSTESGARPAVVRLWRAARDILLHGAECRLSHRLLLFGRLDMHSAGLELRTAALLGAVEAVHRVE
eukprot:352834-Chlamydomonas_euryale.AAC.13